MKHTPGPWTVRLSDRRKDGTLRYFPSVLLGYRKGIRYSDGSGSDEDTRRATQIVINVGPDPDDLQHGFLSNMMETCVANARLIAAAPDLLAVLDDLLGESDFHGDPEACAFCGREKTAAQYDAETQRCDSDDCQSFKARAVLAKAKGS